VNYFHLQVHDSLSQVSAIRARMETDPQFKAAMLSGLWKEASDRQMEDPFRQAGRWLQRIHHFLLRVLVVTGIRLLLLIFTGTHWLLRLFYGFVGFAALFFLVATWFLVTVAHAKTDPAIWAYLWRFEWQMGLLFMIGLALDTGLSFGQGWLSSQIGYKAYQ
jgi:hypothetical protein